MNTKELALLLRDELYDLYEEYPHVIINELSRKKLDANRDMPEATFGVPDIEDAWKLVGLIKQYKILKSKLNKVVGFDCSFIRTSMSQRRLHVYRPSF